MVLNTFPDGLDDKNMKLSMARRSIVAFDDPEIEEVQQRLWSGNLSLKEQRGLGVLFGMVCGDAIGAPLEFSAVRYGVEDFGKDAVNAIPAELWTTQFYNRFRLKPGQWTDDASMGFCLADSLLVHKGNFHPQDLRLRFHNWLGDFDVCLRSTQNKRKGGLWVTTMHLGSTTNDGQKTALGLEATSPSPWESFCKIERRTHLLETETPAEMDLS